MEIAMRGSTGKCTKREGGSILVVSGPSNAEEDGGAKKRGKQRLNSVFVVFFSLFSSAFEGLLTSAGVRRLLTPGPLRGIWFTSFRGA
jgi:hypothetical protein